jgi:SAM-dependent methyltransferase
MKGKNRAGRAWQEFFDGHAPNYLQNCFTKNTVAEVDFLIDALGLSAGASVLDVGCGTGRHAIELARRGYRVTGVDISAGMLEQAKKEAQAAGVEVRGGRMMPRRLCSVSSLMLSSACARALSACWDRAMTRLASRQPSCAAWRRR